MYQFKNGEDLLSLCHTHGMTIGQVMEARERENSHTSPREEMAKNLDVMKQAIEKGIAIDQRSPSGLSGGDAKRLMNYVEGGVTLCGESVLKSVAAAMGVMEVNGTMGLIVASPTAGSCGILPGAFVQKGIALGKDDEALINGLFTAGAIGYIVTKNATVSGAEGGCQAETGTASAMSAAGLVELLGGTPEQALNAAAMTFKNILGLVCDPIGGLVECPCTKRNAIGVTNAMMCADLALA
ncbi:MAG: L-serine ammonia-lyase, iron-sulfur-dependent, subunit alpha, partial [Clostridia bacterium]|nr:L-serine ammonia-lyase, iron-sulfur-dependent, subunit alpha [Clostridia bacterium]